MIFLGIVIGVLFGGGTVAMFLEPYAQLSEDGKDQSDERTLRMINNGLIRDNHRLTELLRKMTDEVERLREPEDKADWWKRE